MAVNEIPLPSVTEVAAQRDKEILYSTEGLVQKGRTFLANASAGPGADGILPSGTIVARLEPSGKWGAYSNAGAAAVNEVQTLTEGGSGLTSFTISFGGETTASLSQAATAAEVEAALEALSTIGEGNVSVTGTGPWTVTFVGDLEATNVAAMTTTPTGGTGTVVVATSSGGVAGGSDIARGVLRNAIDLSGGADVLGNVVLGGVVKYDQLVGYDANALADLNGRVDTVDNYVKF